MVHRLTAKIYRGSEMPETDTALVSHGWLAAPSVGAAAERQNLGVAVGRRIIGSAERRPVAVHVHECVLRRARVRHPTAYSWSQKDAAERGGSLGPARPYVLGFHKFVKKLENPERFRTNKG